jgi:hypothetical protein
MGRIVRNYKNILSKFNTRSLMSIRTANISILDINKSHKKPCKICGHKSYSFVLALALCLTQITWCENHLLIHLI